MFRVNLQSPSCVVCGHDIVISHKFDPSYEVRGHMLYNQEFVRDDVECFCSNCGIKYLPEKLGCIVLER